MNLRIKKAPHVVEGKWVQSTSTTERSLSESESILAHAIADRQQKNSGDLHAAPGHALRGLQPPERFRPGAGDRPGARRGLRAGQGVLGDVLAGEEPAAPAGWLPAGPGTDLALRGAGAGTAASLLATFHQHGRAFVPWAVALLRADRESWPPGLGRLPRCGSAPHEPHADEINRTLSPPRAEVSLKAALSTLNPYVCPVYVMRVREDGATAMESRLASPAALARPGPAYGPQAERSLLPGSPRSLESTRLVAPQPKSRL